MTRPKQITVEMATRVAEDIANELIKRAGFSGAERSEMIGDILSVTRHDRNMDGYKIASALERRHGWDPDFDTAEILDSFSNWCAFALKKAEDEWGAEHPMDPPFAIGAAVTTPHGAGVIDGIYEHKPASYVIETAKGKTIVAFEDVAP